MSKNKILMKSLLISLITFSGAFALQTINHTNNVKADQVQQNNKLYNHSNVMLIDVARQHMNANEIKNIIDNTNPKVFQFIQLHLGDDQGFSVKVPILDNQGWITTQQLNYLSNYAAQKGISLVPDIDVPGHCGGIIKQLNNCKYANYKNIAMDDTTLDYTNIDTSDFVSRLYQQILPAFNNKNAVMIGSDEVPGNVANASSLAQFINSIDDTCHELGFNQVVLWNDSLNKGVQQSLNNDVVVNNWNGNNAQSLHNDDFKLKDCNSNYSNLNISDLNDIDYVRWKANQWKKNDASMLCLWGDSNNKITNQQIIDAIKQFN